MHGQFLQRADGCDGPGRGQPVKRVSPRNDVFARTSGDDEGPGEEESRLTAYRQDDGDVLFQGWYGSPDAAVTVEASCGTNRPATPSRLSVVEESDDTDRRRRRFGAITGGNHLFYEDKGWADTGGD